ncbi:MAG: TrmB family transcriptional regulator [Methanobacteriaceae archaeon]
MENEIISALKIMGLTEYESLAYISLSSMITATASEISENSDIPRSRVYEVLKLLSKKGFIEIETGKPLKYTVIPPSTVFKSNKEQIITELDNAEEELNMRYETHISKVPAPIWMIRGIEKIVKKELEIISRAKHSVNIRIGFLFEGELEQEALMKKVKAAVNRGVDVKIMIGSYSYINGKKVNIIDELGANEYGATKYSKKTTSANSAAKYSFTSTTSSNSPKIINHGLPKVKMIIRDNKEMMHIFAKFNDTGEIVTGSAIGILNHYDEVAKIYNDRFENMWTKKLNKKAKK